MRFRVLQLRLLDCVRERVRRGELTERSLARLTGISQPHMHHVLKGVRMLSPQLADVILRQLDIDLLDLFEAAELERRTPPGPSSAARFREVPILEGYLGSGFPFPAIESRLERYPFLASYVAPLEDPVVSRAAGDAHMAGVFEANDLLLLERSKSRRSQLAPKALFAIEHHSQGLVRHLQLQGSRLYLVPEDGRHDPAAWDCISLADRNILDVVKAKVVWIGRQMEQPPRGQGPTEEAG